MMFYSHAMAEQMNKDIKAYEDNYNLVLNEDKLYVLRFDGVGMTKAFMGNDEMKKTFLYTMKDTVYFFMKQELEIRFAYSYSDEISILLEKSTINRYKGRCEKIISIFSSKITAAFYLAAKKNHLDLNNTLRAFDGRIIELPDIDSVIKYFMARQAFAISSNLIYLRNSILKNFSIDNSKKIIDLLGQRGIIYDEIPNYERFGTIYVNRKFHPSFEFLACKNKLKYLILERKTYQNAFDSSKLKKRHKVYNIQS